VWDTPYLSGPGICSNDCQPGEDVMSWSMSRIAFRIALSILLLVVLVVLLRALLGDRILVVEASSISQVLDLIGVQHVRIRNIIYTQTPRGLTGFSIEWHCSGFVTLMLYILLLLLIPISSLRRSLYIALGFPAIYALNVARIALVIVVANAFGADSAVAIHTFAGPLILVGFVFLLAFTAFREEIVERRQGNASQGKR